MLYINEYIQVVPIKRKKKVILRYIGPYIVSIYISLAYYITRAGIIHGLQTRASIDYVHISSSVWYISFIDGDYQDDSNR